MKCPDCKVAVLIGKELERKVCNTCFKIRNTCTSCNLFVDVGVCIAPGIGRGHKHCMEAEEKKLSDSQLGWVKEPTSLRPHD